VVPEDRHLGGLKLYETKLPLLSSTTTSLSLSFPPSPSYGRPSKMTTIAPGFPAPISTATPKYTSSHSGDGSGASSPTDEKKDAYADVSAVEADEITLNDVLTDEERQKL